MVPFSHADQLAISGPCKGTLTIPEKDTLMKIITGTVLAVEDRPREYNGERWTERVLHLLDGVRTLPVTLQRASQRGPAFDESLLPDKGQVVAVEVYDRGAANKAVYYTGLRVLTEQDIAEALGLLGVK